MRLKYVDKQAVIDLAKTLTPGDIIEFLNTHGDADYYLNAIHNRGQRVGQAFFNSLNFEWQDLLANTPEDPFHSDVEYSVALAVAWLTAQEIANSQ